MKGYGQFCPVAKASEVIGEKWTMLIVREIMAGSHGFNDIRRGVPLMSPSLLSTRLKSLERAGVISKSKDKPVTYTLTDAGEELRPAIDILGRWGQRWARSDLSPRDLDAGLLMWDMRRRLDSSLVHERTVIRFEYYDAPAKHRFWWLKIEPGEVDVCLKNPGHGINLEIRCQLVTMTRVWQGELSIKRAIRDRLIELSGEPALKKSLPSLLLMNTFADVKAAV